MLRAAAMQRKPMRSLPNRAKPQRQTLAILHLFAIYPHRFHTVDPGQVHFRLGRLQLIDSFVEIRAA
jgi:hypothetical protein